MADFKGWSSDLVSSIQDAYPELEDVFYAELGTHFMNKEGGICMAVSEWAVKERVPVMTIHDSFLCPSNHRQELECVIGNAFRFEVLANCVVGKK